jgi:hypothetical protein
MRADSGREAVRTSDAIRRYKDSEVAGRDIAAAVKNVGRKIFYLLDGVWTDRAYVKGKTKETRVAYGSDAYFKLIDEHPELKQYLRSCGLNLSV